MSPKKRTTAADADTTPEADSPAGPPWTEDEWEGQRIFRCRHCKKDSFDLEEMTEHVRYAHSGR